MEVSDSQLKDMVNAAFNHAKKMFEEFGDFYPFGVSLNADGEMGIHGTVKIDDEHDSPELILMLQEMYRKKVWDGEVFATAIGANVDIPPQLPAEYPDGIGVFLETRASARCFYLPYRVVGQSEKSGGDGPKFSVTYGQPIGATMRPEIFCWEAES